MSLIQAKINGTLLAYKEVKIISIKRSNKMKSIFKSYISINFTLVIFLTLFTFCSSPVESDAVNSQEYDLTKQLELLDLEELSPEETDGLLFMREEEKLARDVYLVMYEKWDVRAFSNIAKSEQKHMDAIKVLLDRYSLNDPVTDDKKGKFINSDLQNLYDQLTVMGSESLLAGLKVGAAIEEIDILDLEEQLNNVVDNEDIKLVYNNLLRGSRNHLRAYVRNITNQGETYEPQYMNGDAYEEIIKTDMERGGKGKGKRYGKGMGKNNG